MSTLFDEAEVKKKAASKTEKELIVLGDKKDQKELMDAIKSFKKEKKKADTHKAAADAQKDIIKSFGEGVFLALYEKLGSQPETFYLGNDKNKIQFLVTKRYVTIKDEETFKTLKDMGVAEQKTVYSLNPEMMDTKTMKILDKAIKSSPLPENVQKHLIKKSVEKNVKSNTLERLPIVTEKFKQKMIKAKVDKDKIEEFDIGSVYEAVAPVCQVKNVGK